MNIEGKMIPAFSKLSGGLFENVMKADVGCGYIEMGKKGVDLMGWADPFYPDPSLPKHIFEAAYESLKTGFPAHYTMPRGSLELRHIIAEKLKKENDISADPERNIIVTPGSDSGLLFAMMPFIGNGDEVIVFDPSYPNNFLNPEILGGVTVRVPTYEKDNYQIDIDEVKKSITSKTKMILLTNPNNPTTTVYGRENLEELCKLIVEYDLVAVVDQAFENTVFDEKEFVNIANLPGMWERTLSVFSISKGMGLSGFRVGYIVACEEIMDKLYASSVSVLGATSTLSQAVAIAAFKNDKFIKEYRNKFDLRRKAAYEIINSVPGAHMMLPESGFYSWINVSELADSTRISNYLIEKASVAVNDGKTYGHQGDGYIRVIHGSYKEDDRAIKVMENIKRALTEFTK